MSWVEEHIPQKRLLNNSRKNRLHSGISRIQAVFLHMSLFFVPFVHPMGDDGGKSVFFQPLGMTGTKDAEKRIMADHSRLFNLLISAYCRQKRLFRPLRREHDSWRYRHQRQSDGIW